MVKKLGLKLKEQKGFTLIELLAVIVILGIIAAIAIPAISSVINKSEVKAQAQEGVQIINAAKLIVANNEVEFGASDLEVEIYDTTSHTSVTTETVFLMDYLDRVDADAGFSVTVKRPTTTSTNYTYTLNDHPADTTGSGILEQNLIETAK